MRKSILTLMVVFAFVLNATAQSREITGRVNDEKGMPVPGVSVLPSSGRNGTQTDKEGNYKIVLSPNARTLTFSSVGFETQVIAVRSSNTVYATLKVADGKLSEVVITGYTVRKRAESAAADSKVSAKEIEQVPIASFENILQGRAPGLYVASASGQPGSAARVNIRGVGTIGGNSDPLYILDGMPIEAEVFRTLNPNDFETIDVLKDAAGAGQYGSRAGNGVIVITSKKGRAGKTQFQYRGQVGFAEAPTEQNLQLMNTSQRLQYEGNFLGPAGVIGAGTATGFPGWDYSPNNPAYQASTPAQQAIFAGKLDSVSKINTDWAKIFFQRGTFKQNELNASGGSQNMTFYTSLSAYQQQGVVIRSNLDRYTFRGNMDIRGDRVTVSIRSSAGYSSLKGIESEAGVALANPIAAAYLELPYRALYKSPNVIDTGSGKTGANAYDRSNTTTAVTNQFKGNLAITVQYRIWKGLSFKMTNGVDYRNNNTSRYIDPNSFAGHSPAGGQGSYNEGNSENLQLVNTTGLVYTNTFGAKHQVNLQVMSESIRNKFRSFNATGFGLNRALSNTPAAITPGSTTNNEIPLIGGSKTINGISSIFVLGDYTYNKRYTLSGTYRRDASSVVPIANRVIQTGTGGIAWNMTEEKFMKRQHIFQEARLRASYGELANLNAFNITGIGDFSYIALYGSGSYSGVSGIIPTSPGNPDLKIESQVITNIGADFSLWHSRLRVTADIYKKVSKNLLVTQGVSRTSGFNSLATNAGKVENRGLDFKIDADVVSSKSFLVTVGVNGGFNRNRITSLGQFNEIIPTNTIQTYRVGLPLGTHYIVQYLGVNPQSGLPVYADVNGNPTTDYLGANKRATFGTYLPSFTGGASVDITWNNFDLGILLSTAQGVKRVDNESLFFESTNANTSFNKIVQMLTSWQTPGQMTSYQKINSTYAASGTSEDIRDASFVRLRNVRAGYTFNTKAGKPIRSFRVWGQGENLFTWTKWTGFDPEESNNIATYEFPNPKSYSIGLDINF